MIWQQYLDGIRAHIDNLEHDLAEVDAMLSTHASTIDSNPRSSWPKGSILAKAIDRHAERVMAEQIRELRRQG